MATFQYDLNDPINRIQERRAPDADRSGSIIGRGVSDAVAAIGEIDFNAGAASDKQEVFAQLEQDVQTQYVDPSVEVIATGMNQGRISRQEGIVRLNAIAKNYIANNPAYAQDIRDRIKNITGLNPQQTAADLAFEQEMVQKSIRQDAEKAAITKAVKDGDAVYDVNGQLDFEATMAQQQTSFAIQRNIEIKKRMADQGKIDKTDYENSLQVNYLQGVNQKVQNSISNIFNRGIQNPDGSFTPFAEATDAQIAAAVTQNMSEAKIVLNSQVTGLGLSVEATKKLRDQTDSMLADMGQLFLGANKAELEASKNYLATFETQAQIGFTQAAPLAAQWKAIYGQDAFGQAALKFSLSGAVLQAQEAQTKAYFESMGRRYIVDTPALARTSAEVALAMSSNPDATMNMADEQVILAVTPAMKSIQESWKNSNNMSRQQDSVYLNNSSNLAGLGLQQRTTLSDNQKLLNEITNPLWLKTFNAVKQRQVDPALTLKTGTKVSQFLEKQVMGEAARLRGLNLTIAGTKNPAARVRTDADTGKLVLEVTDPKIKGLVNSGVSFGGGISPTGTTTELDTLRQINQAQAQVDRINKSVDTLVGLKEFSNFSEVSNDKYRSRILKDLTVVPAVQEQSSSGVPDNRVIVQNTTTGEYAIVERTGNASDMQLQTLYNQGGLEPTQVFGTLDGAESVLEGAIEPGNIDTASRVRLQNADGTVSTLQSISVNIDGREVLIPTISPNGERLTEDEAIELYRSTGQHLGIFRTPQEATRYARSLSERLGG